MKKLLAIYPFVLCLLAGCAPSNIQKVEISNMVSSKQVNVRFSEYKRVQLKLKTYESHYNYWITRLDKLKLNKSDTGAIRLWVEKCASSDMIDFGSTIDCVVRVNQDSTIVIFDGFENGKQYHIFRQTKEGYMLSLTYYSSNDAPVSADEKEFLKKLSLGIFIEE